jgi:uncharacterized protein (TIGR03083 family)
VATFDVCDELQSELARLYDAIDAADPATPVPSCPGWTVADLTEHVRGTQRWVERMVRERQRVRFRDVTENITPQQLVDTLRAADPDLELYWFGQDQSVRFFRRRMLDEALVHRLDVELALGRPSEIDPAIAADAVDEFLENLVAFPWLRERLAGLDRWGDSLHLHATDGAGEWLLTLREPGFEWSHDHGKATVAVQATAPELLMLAYSRLDPDDPRLVVFGDATLLQKWQEQTNF